MLIQKYSSAPPFCLRTSPAPPQQINPFLSHFSLPLWHRYTGRGFSKGRQLSKGGLHYDYLNLCADESTQTRSSTHCVRTHLKAQPLLQRIHHFPVPGRRAKGQEEGPCPRNPTEIKPMPPNFHTCYYSQSLLAQDSQQALLYSHWNALHTQSSISTRY